MGELNTVVHFSPVRFYFTMMVLNFIFIVHPTNASVEFLQLNPAHNDDKYVPGRRQVRILENRKQRAAVHDESTARFESRYLIRMNKYRVDPEVSNNFIVFPGWTS